MEYMVFPLFQQSSIKIFQPSNILLILNGGRHELDDTFQVLQCQLGALDWIIGIHHFICRCGPENLHLTLVEPKPRNGILHPYNTL